MQMLAALLAEAQQQHGHGCAGAVLGVRVALAGCRAVGIEDPRRERSLIVLVEIDRCAADAIQSVTGCSLGRRTLKYMDYGKLAATFVNMRTGEAVRVAVHPGARRAAEAWQRGGLDKNAAQKLAYQELPDAELLTVEQVEVCLAPEDMPGRPVGRTCCDRCGEEVNDRREVHREDATLCRSCASGAYYRVLERVRH